MAQLHRGRVITSSTEEKHLVGIIYLVCQPHSPAVFLAPNPGLPEQMVDAERKQQEMLPKINKQREEMQLQKFIEPRKFHYKCLVVLSDQPKGKRLGNKALVHWLLCPNLKF